MLPIPNPPETAPRSRYGYGWRRHPHHHRWAGAYGATAYAHPHHVHHHRFGYATTPARRTPHHEVAHAAARPSTPAPAPAQAQPTGSQLTKPAALDHHRHHHHPASDAAAVAAASGGAPNATGPANTTEAASEADHYQALQQSLADAFASGARLTAPAHMETNQASTVTLTVPADFAQTVHSEAAKQTLASQAATVNLMASLTGDGYMIVPGEAQTKPLTLNTPTTFDWKVTPTGTGRAPLKASARAAVGDGHDLTLGDKTTGGNGSSGRVLGIGLLALIALLLLGWAAQRRRPKPNGASKPRPTHTNGTPT